MPNSAFPKLSAHPFADLFPSLSEDEKNDLADDIKLNGLIHPIITFENQILDGKHRYEACLDVGVPPRLQNYQGDNPLGFVCSVNLMRRHLTTSQRAMIASKLETLPSGQRFKKVEKVNNENGVFKASESMFSGGANLRIPQIEVTRKTTITRSDAATAMNVSTRAVDSASRVLRESPALASEVQNGKMTVNGALRELQNQKSKSEPPPVEYDKEGWPIPPKILELWKRADTEAKEALQNISKVRSMLRNGIEANDVAFAEIAYQENDMMLQTLYSNFKLVIPHGVCTVCQGKVPESCTLCKGRGYLSAFAYKMFGSDEVKKIREKQKGV